MTLGLRRAWIFKLDIKYAISPLKQMILQQLLSFKAYITQITHQKGVYVVVKELKIYSRHGLGLITLSSSFLLLNIWPCLYLSYYVIAFLIQKVRSFFNVRKYKRCLEWHLNYVIFKKEYKVHSSCCRASSTKFRLLKCVNVFAFLIEELFQMIPCTQYVNKQLSF